MKQSKEVSITSAIPQTETINLIHNRWEIVLNKRGFPTSPTAEKITMPIAIKEQVDKKVVDTINEVRNNPKYYSWNRTNSGLQALEMITNRVLKERIQHPIIKVSLYGDDGVQECAVIDVSYDEKYIKTIDNSPDKLFLEANKDENTVHRRAIRP